MVKSCESVAFELPEAATLLNKLKRRRKKSKADLADVEAIIEAILKKLSGDCDE
jgi:hypothetical protein